MEQSTTLQYHFARPPPSGNKIMKKKIHVRQAGHHQKSVDVVH